MKKQARHEAILQLIQQKQISRQEDFVTELENMGEMVTQATISRDINALNLVKIPKPDGGFYYGLSDTNKRPGEQKLRRVLQRNFLGSRYQTSQILLKVQPGTGAIIANLIDQMHWKVVFGTLADDDTVMIFMADCYTSADWLPVLQELLQD